MQESQDTPSDDDRPGLSDRLRRLRDISPERKRRLKIVGGLLLAVVLLIVIPAYLGWQPGFFERYPEMEVQYDEWSVSAHAKVRCQECHVHPGPIAQTAYGVRMIGEVYLAPVFSSRRPDVLKQPVNEACEKCHIDLRTVSPSGDLLIPHRAHVDALELDCVQCHDFLVHEESPDGRHVPRMESCLVCHDGEQAKDACVVCHTEKAAPEDHASPDWVIVHPDEQDADDCESCHAWTDDWCVECHSRRPVSHVETWRSEHRYPVEEHRNCEACHEGDFCITCHGVVPDLNYDPALELVQ